LLTHRSSWDMAAAGAAPLQQRSTCQSTKPPVECDLDSGNGSGSNQALKGGIPGSKVVSPAPAVLYMLGCPRRASCYLA